MTGFRRPNVCRPCSGATDTVTPVGVCVTPARPCRQRRLGDEYAVDIADGDSECFVFRRL